MKQIDRINDYINYYGSITVKEAIDDVGIGSLTKKISEMKQGGLPIKRLAVRRINKNRYGERPKYYRYYYDADRVVLAENEEVVRWIDEIQEPESQD